MPIPFKESFIFNWSLFDGKHIHSVAFWYQEQTAEIDDLQNEFFYKIHCLFKLEEFDKITPTFKLPEKIFPYSWLESAESIKSKSWLKKSQRGFVYL